MNVGFIHRVSRVKSLPQISALLTRDNRLFGSVANEKRLCVPLHAISPEMIRTLLAIEDRRFFTHGAIDVHGIARAVVANFRAMRIVQGGSTITQQLARSAVLHMQHRTLRRKLLEIGVALVLERTLSKHQILSAYLNAVHFGHGIYGIEYASLYYCGKSASALNERDAACLVAILRAPARYCCCCNPQRAKMRTELVLGIVNPRTPCMLSVSPLSNTDVDGIGFPSCRYNAVQWEGRFSKGFG